MHLGKSCAHPGDTQSVTVTQAQPKARMIYDTTYSNNTDSANAHYTTGFGYGNADASGTFSATWVINLNVPTGSTTVTAASSDGRGFREGRGTFTIVAAGQPCP